MKVNYRQRKTTIHHKLMQRFSILFFIVLFLLYITTYFFYVYSQTKTATEYSLSLSCQIADNFDIYFSELSKTLEISSTDRDLVSFFEETENSNDYELLLKRKNVQAILNDIQEKRQDIVNVAVFNQNTYVGIDNYKVLDQGDPFLNMVWDDMNSSSQLEVKYYSPHVLNYYLRPYDRGRPMVISIAYPIRKLVGMNSENKAVIIFDITSTKIQQLISKATISQGQTVLISDQNFQVVYSNAQDKYIASTIQENESLNELNFKDKGMFIVNINGEKNLLTYATINSNGWKIIFFHHFKEIISGSNQLLLFTIGAFLISFIVIFLISMRLSNKIVGPIKGLVNQMEHVQENSKLLNLESRTDLVEIDSLYSGYNFMISQIETLTLAKYEAELRQKEAEFKALQAQINPHFLNNILQMIQSLAVLKQTNEICTITTALGELLEYSIYERKEQVKLFQEMEYIKRYLEIQKIRLGDSFCYTVHLDHSLNNYEVPKFILQPLVENAIIHGLNGMEHKMLSVDCFSLNSKVFLVVQDNGIGIEEARLKQIRIEMLNITKKSNSIGLSNVNHRIKLLFGAQYGLEIESEVGKGTCVSLILPGEKE